MQVKASSDYLVWFLGAGAKSVIMTHWQIDDQFSSLLMPKFYDKLLNHEVPLTDALTLAKREMLKGEFAHPVYWAPFVLSGQPMIQYKNQLFSWFRFSGVVFLMGLILLVSRYVGYQSLKQFEE